MSSPIDLSLLPAPNIVEPLDYETILGERKARLIALYPEEEHQLMAELLELESEPLVKLLEENAYRELLLRQRINEAARAVMISYTRQDDLDNLVANFNVKRLQISPGNPNATPPIPPTYESDTALRLRAQEAWEGLSAAGPTSAYEFHARSADGRIVDARALSPAPCEALITVLSQEGNGQASQELIDIVHAALTPETIRPVGDRVTVQSAVIVDYAVVAELYLYRDAETTQAPILAAAKKRLQAFIDAQHRQRRRLGVSIYRDAIKAALHVEGVEHVELIQPVEHLIIDNTQAARCISAAVTIEGSDAS